MNTHITNALIDIERRIQEILDDLHSVQEQIFYAYDSDEADTAICQEDFETEQQAAFEYLVNADK